METHDQQLFALTIDLCDDDDVLLRQERCPACLEDVFVRLHRSQVPLVAEIAGYVPANEVQRATARLQDRLDLLVSLVRAHSKAGDPLRIVVDDLMSGRQEPAVSHIQPPIEKSDGQTSPINLK